jgi:mono/diheme cytochrome c family protein
MNATLGLILGGLLATVQPGFAQTPAPTLDPVAAAGKVIFEETAGGVGCAACHGMDATGDIGPNIRGQDSVAVLQALSANEDMQFIELSKDEVDQVAAYLRYLHDIEAH